MAFAGIVDGDDNAFESPDVEVAESLASPPLVLLALGLICEKNKWRRTAAFDIFFDGWKFGASMLLAVVDFADSLHVAGAKSGEWTFKDDLFGGDCCSELQSLNAVISTECSPLTAFSFDANWSSTSGILFDCESRDTFRCCCDNNGGNRLANAVRLWFDDKLAESMSSLQILNERSLFMLALSALPMSCEIFECEKVFRHLRHGTTLI